MVTSLLPVIERESVGRCPFYGFSYMHGIFMDTKGNQCGLVKAAFSPCQMELSVGSPDWGKCPYHTKRREAIIEKFGDSIRVFPEELRPNDVTSWEGITLRQWIKYVLNSGIS